MQVDRSGEIRKHRPAHATVVAYLALFVALGGTATALKGKNSVFSQDIKNGQVKKQDLAKGAVKRGKIAKRAVNSQRLAPRAVTTSRLVPGAVVSRILAADAVTSDKIADGQVTSNDIAAQAVGGGKIRKSAIGSGKIKGSAVTDAKIAKGAVTTEKIAAGAVTANELGAGSIPVGKLSSTVVTAGAPVAAGRGGPVLEFIEVAEVGPGAVAQIAAISGLAKYLAECDVGGTPGAHVQFVNDAASAQTVITDDGAGTVTADPSVAPGVGATAAEGDGDEHVSLLSHDPATGASAHAEVFADHEAGGCTFYTWIISR